MSTLRRQGVWAVVDQVLSSGTNFVPALLLARALGPSSYGAFSLVFLAWFTALGLLQTALMRPYTLASSSLTGDAWHRITQEAGGAVVIGGLLCSAAFLVVHVVAGPSSEFGQSFLVLAILAPGLALQEFWRSAAFSASRARTAAANDLCWVIGQVVAFGFVLWRGEFTVTIGLIAWGVGAWLAAGLGILQLSVVPSVSRAAVRWARRWARLGGWFTLESITYALGTLAIALAIAASVGHRGLGYFRSVQNLFGPVQLFTMGITSVYLPHLVRVLRGRMDRGIGESRRFSMLMAAANAVYAVVLVVTASTLLTSVFGADFAPASYLVLPMSIAFALDAVGSGAVLLLSARQQASRLLLTQVIATVVRVGSVVLLVNVGGLRAGVWGLVLGSAAFAVALWIEVGRTSSVTLAASDGESPDVQRFPETSVSSAPRSSGY